MCLAQLDDASVSFASLGGEAWYAARKMFNFNLFETFKWFLLSRFARATELLASTFHTSSSYHICSRVWLSNGLNRFISDRWPSLLMVDGEFKNLAMRFCSLWLCGNVGALHNHHHHSSISARSSTSDAKVTFHQNWSINFECTARAVGYLRDSPEHGEKHAERRK